MNVYHLVGPAPYSTNCFLAVTEAGSGVLVDPTASVQELEQLLKEKNAKLTHILLTHGHFDHVTHVVELAQRWGCKVYMDVQDAQGSELMPLLPAQITDGYQNGAGIAVDEVEFVTWHTPGHTAGSWVIYSQGLLFTGDTLFAGSVGRTDLGGDPMEQRRTLQKLQNLPLVGDTKVLPGHGVFTTLQQEFETNPFFR